MKIPTVLVLVVFALLCAPASGLADGNNPTLAKCILTLSPEIDCPSCEDGIKRVLVTAHGVQSAEVDVLTNKVTVRYDPACINVKALIGRIAVMGYTAKEDKQPRLKKFQEPRFKAQGRVKNQGSSKHEPTWRHTLPRPMP